MIFLKCGFFISCSSILDFYIWRAVRSSAAFYTFSAAIFAPFQYIFVYAILGGLIKTGSQYYMAISPARAIWALIDMALSLLMGSNHGDHTVPWD